MKRVNVIVAAVILISSGCSKKSGIESALQPKASGSQISEVSGGKQITSVGSELPQPVVVQVNDDKGTAVAGALVSFHGDGTQFRPAQALTDSSGQVTATVRLGFAPGDYEMVAETPKTGGGATTLKLRQTALGYEQTLGKQVNDGYCIRCHDPESTTERVSNFENLTPSPHAFTDGAFFNSWSDADLIMIIAEGGTAVKKSPAQPAFGKTLTPRQIKAVVAYMRAVADLPYQPPGVKK
ncbi:MAG TPA: c-type cytochrome [Terriglobales bacterium]